MPFLTVFILLLEKSQSLFPFQLNQQKVKDHSILGCKPIVPCYLSDFLQQGRNTAIPEIYETDFFLLPCNLQNKVRMIHTSTWTTPKDHRYMWKRNTPFLFPLLLFSFFYFTLPQFKSSTGFISGDKICITSYKQIQLDQAPSSGMQITSSGTGWIWELVCS